MVFQKTLERHYRVNNFPTKRFPWNTKHPVQMAAIVEVKIKWVLVGMLGSIKWGIVIDYWYSWKEKNWPMHAKMLKQKTNSACAHQSYKKNS